MHMKSFGTGPFEFPIPGNYEVRVGPQATELVDKSAGRAFTVGRFSRPPGGSSTVANKIKQLADLSERNWQQFAQDEGGRIVMPFRRRDVGPNLTVVSMATEFTTASGPEFYINIAATDGSQIATVIVEGLGSAKAAYESLVPLAEAVRFAPESQKLP